MTDVAYLLSVLQDGEPHSSTEILRRSFDDRGHGLMVHSRISDLRAQGHQIVSKRVPGKRRGDAFTYTLSPTGSLAEPLSPEAPPSSTDQGAARVGGASTLFDLPARKPAWS